MNAKNFGTMAWTAFLKTLLLVFNLAFFAIGLAFFVVGIYGIKMFKDFFTFAPGNMIYLPFISIGAFMMLVGMLSLWCTPKGVSWLLYVYGIIVFILFVAILALSAAFVVKRDTFEQKLEDGIERALTIYPQEQEAIDSMQAAIHCCGSNNYTDWYATSWGQITENVGKVPISCCKNQTNCDQGLTAEIYIDGCYSLVHHAIESNYQLISGIGFASAIVVMFASLISCSLARNLNKNRYEQVE